MEINATTPSEPIIENPDTAAAAHPEIISCKNCDNQFHGNFCNNCGQSAKIHTINWHYVVHDIQHGVFHVDKGILFTIKELIVRPGLTIRHFINGKRIDYFKPSALVFILASIYGFLFLYLDINLMPDLGSTDLTEEQKMALGLQSWVTSHYALYILMTIPLFALASYLAFRKSGYNFIEHLVINLYLASIKMVLQIIALPFLYMSQQTPMINVFLMIYVVADLALLFYVFGNVFNMFSKTGRFFRTILSYILIFAFSLIIGIVAGIIMKLKS